MTVTAIDATTIEPIGHKEAFGLAREEYRRFAAELSGLEPSDWERPTACTGWTVRDMAGHLLGAMRSAASMRELMSQQREIKGRVKADGGNEVDHMTAVQIERTAGLDTSQLVDECTRLAEPAAAGRRRTPAPMRRLVKIPVDLGQIKETWRLGYLVDVILTRDTWMHRLDLARAVDRPMLLDADHDGRIVADVVGEWARRHGRPFDLRLTGPAGGRFTADGPDPERIEIDTLDFCLAISGRAEGAGLLDRQVAW